MPFSVDVDRARGLVRICVEGSVRVAELLELSRTARAEPLIQAGAAVLYDCRGVTDVGVSSTLIHTLGARARQDTNRVAFIAETPVAIGLARMYQIVSRGEERMRVFGTEDAALQWLLGSDMSAGTSGGKTLY